MRNLIHTTLFMEHFYILDDGRVRQFLISGEEQALLIDAGFPLSLKEGRLQGERHPAMPCNVYKGSWTEFYYAEQDTPK